MCKVKIHGRMYSGRMASTGKFSISVRCISHDGSQSLVVMPTHVPVPVSVFIEMYSF